MVSFLYDHHQRTHNRTVTGTPATGPLSPGLLDHAPASRVVPAAAQATETGAEVLRQERVEDRVETAVGVGEAVGRQTNRDERVRDLGLVLDLGVEVLDHEDDVDRQPAGAEGCYDDDHQASGTASNSCGVGRPGRPMAARYAAVTTAEEPDDHSGVQDADEGHRKNEGEREERAVEDSAVVRSVGQQTDVETRRANNLRVVVSITNNLYRHTVQSRRMFEKYTYATEQKRI